MTKKGFLLFGALVLISVFELHEVEALKCYRCSSDASGTPFCDDPFDDSIITEAQRRWAYVDCSLPPPGRSQYVLYESQTSRPVCKKMKQIINDRVVISRSCSYEDINASPDRCMRTSTPSYIKTEFCETCLNDGCNGASKFTAATLFTFIPAIFAFVLAL